MTLKWCFVLMFDLGAIGGAIVGTVFAFTKGAPLLPAVIFGTAFGAVTLCVSAPLWFHTFFVPYSYGG